MKILIAEDDDVLRLFLERKLTNWGYEVVPVSDGSKAWDALQQDDAPKLAVVDWMMPEMNGIDICRRLRQNETTASTYVILLTARDDRQDILQGLNAGADDYVTKPFDNEELRARVNVGRRVIELQAVQQERDRLQGTIKTVAKVCHEMNQPLQVVSGTTELLMLDIKKDNPYFEKIDKIKTHIDKMGHITRKLMGMTHNQSNN